MDWYDIKVRKDALKAKISDFRLKISIPAEFWPLLVQLAGAGCILYGISLYSHPIAFIIGGLAAILAIEMQSKEKKMNPEEVLHHQQQIKLALAAVQDPFSSPYNVPLTPAWITYAASLRKQR
jgi:hypothetical protein